MQLERAWRKQYATREEKYKYEKCRRTQTIASKTGFERARRQAQWHVYTTNRARHTQTPETPINIADFTRLTRGRRHRPRNEFLVEIVCSGLLNMYSDMGWSTVTASVGCAAHVCTVSIHWVFQFKISTLEIVLNGSMWTEVRRHSSSNKIVIYWALGFPLRIA